MVANSVGQAAGSDQTDQFNGGHTQRNPSEDVSSSIDELSEARLATAGEGNAQRSSSSLAARLWHVAQPVQSRILTATFKLKFVGKSAVKESG